MANRTIYELSDGSFTQRGKAVVLDSRSYSPRPGKNLNRAFEGKTKAKLLAMGVAVVDYVAQFENPEAVQSVLDAQAEYISEERRKANNGTFTHDGKVFDAHADAKSEITATHGEVLVLNAMPSKWGGEWFTASGESYPINTVDAWLAFHRSMFDAGIDNAQKAQSLITQLHIINANNELSDAEKITQMKAINWDS